MPHWTAREWTIEPLYTVKECRAEIREIDAEIKLLRQSPESQTLAGDSISFSGRLEDLRQLRRDWEARLKEALAHEGYQKRRSGMQGPDRDLQ